MPWYLPSRGPLLWEELRRRMRGGRGFLVMLIYSVLLVLMLLGAAATDGVGDNPREWPDFGKTLWQIFLVSQLGAVLLISPGIAAGAISTEREKGTLEMLFLTPLSSLALVAEKFVGAVGQMLVIVLSGLPVVAVVFVYGGVSPAEVATGYTLILATGLLYSALGMLASCICRRTAAAVAWAYGFMLMLVVLTPVGLLILMVLNPAETMLVSETPWVMMGNPALLYVLYLSPFESIRPSAPFWMPIAAMTAGSAAIIVWCARTVAKMRCAPSVFSRLASLDIARFNSRPAHQSAEREPAGES